MKYCNNKEGFYVFSCCSSSKNPRGWSAHTKDSIPIHVRHNILADRGRKQCSTGWDRHQVTPSSTTAASHCLPVEKNILIKYIYCGDVQGMSFAGSRRSGSVTWPHASTCVSMLRIKSVWPVTPRIQTRSSDYIQWSRWWTIQLSIYFHLFHCSAVFHTSELCFMSVAFCLFS